MTRLLHAAALAALLLACWPAAAPQHVTANIDGAAAVATARRERAERS